MSKPRDHYVTDRVGAVGLARLFSNLVSPPVIFALLGLLLAWYELPFWPALFWSAVFGLFASLLPILFVLMLLRNDHIEELHMSNTAERQLPYLVAGGSSFLALALILLFDGPELLRCLSLFNVVMLALIGLINSYWLISFHATGATAMLLVVWIVFGPPVFAPLLFVDLSVLAALGLWDLQEKVEASARAVA